MADRFDIARALQGFGAGVAGQGQQFLQGIDDQRKQALLQDAFSVQQALQEGRTPQARELLLSRLDNINRLGGDPSDTQGLLSKIDSGDIRGAFQDVSTVVEFAQAEGLLKTPATDKGTSLVQNIEATGLKRGTPEFERALRTLLSKPGQTINIGGDGGLTPEQRIELAAKTKRAEKLAEVRATGVATRESTDIAAGSGASRAVPNLQRSLDLLGEIKTGGIDAVLLKAKQFIGVESANEAELVNAMSKNVIAQLKPVFGAQFTKAEGDWLKAIEAGTTKSTAGNIRLIERGLFLAKKRAATGLKAAISAKDFRSAQEIQDFLDTDLTPGGVVPPQRLKFDAQGNQI